MSLLVAMLLDAALGEPRWLWSRVPHPAILMGRAVDWGDRRFNRLTFRRARGAVVLLGLIALAGIAGALIEWAGAIPTALAAAILLAQRSLVDHVRAVARGLGGSIDEGRHAVAMIVGRDTAAMDSAQVARAAIESAAENLSDGVVAPVFWFVVAGLPGMAIYKMVNTADSMIGHRTPRHGEFGWAAARLDDVLNWLPARLTALLIALPHGVTGLRDIARDARRHRSPNAGWPESAMARVLDVALSGPRSYGGTLTEFPFVHPRGIRDPGRSEVDAATGVLWRSWATLVVLIATLALV